MPCVRLRWRFQAEQHFRTIRGKLWRFDKTDPIDVPDNVLAEIAENYSDVLEQVEPVDGKPNKWKPVEPEAEPEETAGRKAKRGKPREAVLNGNPA